MFFFRTFRHIATTISCPRHATKRPVESSAQNHSADQGSIQSVEATGIVVSGTQNLPHPRRILLPKSKQKELFPYSSFSPNPPSTERSEAAPVEGKPPTSTDVESRSVRCIVEDATPTGLPREGRARGCAERPRHGGPQDL